MFNNSMIKVASSAALGLLTLENVGVDARSSYNDRKDYPDIAKAF